MKFFMEICTDHVPIRIHSTVVAHQDALCDYTYVALRMWLLTCCLTTLYHLKLQSCDYCTVGLYSTMYVRTLEAKLLRDTF